MNSAARALIAAVLLFGILRPVSADEHLSPRLKAITVYAPFPTYPAEGIKRPRGSTTVGLDVDKASGLVTKAQLTQSSGSAAIDKATLNTLRRWRFKPGAVEHIEVPFGFYDFDPDVSYSYFGTIKLIDPQTNTLTLVSRMSAIVHVAVTPQTRISSAGKSIAFRDLAVGNRVQGQATITASHQVIAVTMMLKPPAR